VWPSFHCMEGACKAAQVVVVVAVQDSSSTWSHSAQPHASDRGTWVSTCAQA
jgi:hypothetical protein